MKEKQNFINFLKVYSSYFFTISFFIFASFFIQFLGFFSFAMNCRAIYLILGIICIFKIISPKVQKIKKWIVAEYLFLQVVLLVSLTVVSVLKYPLYDFTVKGLSTFPQVIILLIFAITGFVLKKWISLRENESEPRLFTSLFNLFELNIIPALLLTVVNFLFKLDYTFLLSWLFWVNFLLIMIGLIKNLIVALIRKEALDWFDYSFFFVSKKNRGTDGGEGFLEIIEKNLGLSFKSLWSVKYIFSILPFFFLGVLLFLFLSTSLYSIKPYENGVLFRFGRLQDEAIKPGFHCKFPWPIDKIEIYDVDRVKGMQIGYVADESVDFLWTQEHDGGEYFLLLGDGIELVAVNLKLVYTISDVLDYVRNYESPEGFLSAKAYEILMEKTHTTVVENLLSHDRQILTTSFKEELNRYSVEKGIGLMVEEVVMESIHPPVSTADVYQGVVSAAIKKKTLVTNAELSAFEILTKAQQEGRVAVFEAKANQTTKVSNAKYEMAIYDSAFSIYKSHPASFKLSKYLLTYEKIINGKKTYVFSPNLEGDLSEYIINQSEDSLPLPLQEITNE